MIDVALVDDEALVRAGLVALIDAEDDMRVVGEAEDGAGAIDLVRRARPHIVLMDIRMPKVDGIVATHSLIHAVERPPDVVVLTTFENDDHVYRALRAGASGFLLKRSPPGDILSAIRLIHAGESLLFPASIRTLAAANPPADTAAARAIRTLTEREANTLTLIARGLSNAEIAEREHVSVETVKSHVSSLLAKLAVRDRTQAVIAAYDAGLVRPGER